jgi:hypothetical protein
MKFTFVILLFCGLGADAQMIIKAHPNYVPFASDNILLDQYSGAAAAYSLRKLRTAYTGSAIRVRRSNDNSEQDIGFTSGGDLDTASLKTFVGANSGFVTTWYDQSGNARNATQTTAADQPRIINAGTIQRENGDPTVFFDGSNDNISTTHVMSYPFSTFTVSKRNTGVTSAIIANGFITNMGATTWGLFTESSSFILRARQTFNASIADNANLFLGYSSRISNTSYVGLNGSSLNSANLFGASTYTASTFIGGTGASRLMNGVISEIIIYHSDQITNRNAIETNINSYYGIY